MSVAQCLPLACVNLLGIKCVGVFKLSLWCRSLRRRRRRRHNSGHCVVAEFVGVFLFQFIGGGADANSISTGRCPRCPAVPCPAPRHVSSDPA